MTSGLVEDGGEALGRGAVGERNGAGTNDFGLGPPSLAHGRAGTSEQCHTGFMDTVDQLSAATRAGEDVPQISNAP